MGMIMEAIRGIRNIRTQMNVPVNRRTHILVVSPSEAVRSQLANSMPFLSRLALVSGIETRETRAGIPDSAVTAIFDGGEIFIPLEDLIDIAQEIARLEKEQASLEQELARVAAKLANAEFTSRAPEKGRPGGTRQSCSLRADVHQPDVAHRPAGALKEQWPRPAPVNARRNTAQHTATPVNARRNTSQHTTLGESVSSFG